MSSDQIFVGLEIGTTQDLRRRRRGTLRGPDQHPRGGRTPSRGIRKGEIVDMATATECVREAILDAEEKTNVEIGNVWVAITGGHLRSLNNRGIHVLPHPRQIVQEDLDQVPDQRQGDRHPAPRTSSSTRSSSRITSTATATSSIRSSRRGCSSRPTFTSSTG